VSAKTRPWILAATILGSSMAFIDSTVVNIALPALQASLGATITDVQWVVEAYSLFLAALMLTGGGLGDRFGRRRIFALGVVVFTAASVVCGFAMGIAWLVAARAVQGVGAALLVPGSLAIISASFPDAERGKAIGTWSAFTSITMVIGPLVGGGLIDHISWRAIFFINVPLAAIVFFLTLRYVPESRERANRRLDFAGAALATLGLGAVVYGLIESSNLGFAHPLIAGSLATGAGLLALFAIVQWKSASPMMPLALFGSRAFAGANALTLFLYAALAGGLFFVPLNLIQLQGFTATQAGAATVPSVLILAALSRRSGALADRLGAKGFLVAGPLIAAAGFALFMVPGLEASYWTQFFPATVVLGFGMAITVAPLTNTVMSSVVRDHAGIASGINNAVSETAGVLAVAVFGLLMAQVFSARLDAGMERARIPLALQQQVRAQAPKLAAIEIPKGTEAARSALKEAIGESFVAGFRRVELAAALLAAASALWGWLALSRGRARGASGGRRHRANGARASRGGR
jgi:EmrB/QacA subfamily drug resistance transporter